jgi:hypothetical protein
LRDAAASLYTAPAASWPGSVPAIHVVERRGGFERTREGVPERALKLADVDGWDRPGHDGAG